MARPPGPKKFARFLKKHGISIRKAAEGLHVSDPTILGWRRGEKNPTKEHRKAIRVFTKDEIVEDDWRTELEREQAQHASEVRPFDSEECSATGTDGGRS